MFKLRPLLETGLLVTVAGTDDMVPRQRRLVCDASVHLCGQVRLSLGVLASLHAIASRSASMGVRFVGDAFGGSLGDTVTYEPRPGRAPLVVVTIGCPRL